MLGVGTSALGNLQDQGSTLFDSGLSDALDDLHVVDVESADGVAAVVATDTLSVRRKRAVVCIRRRIS